MGWAIVLTKFYVFISSNYEKIAFIISNFRSDRVREIALALGDENFDGFKRKKTAHFLVKVG